MEGSKLIAALADCLKTFSKGFDQIQETARKVAAARAIAINKAIDLAKVEGLKPAQIVTLIDSEVLKPAFDCDVISGPTRYQYRSGIGKALAHNVAWYPKAFELPAIEEPGKKTRGRKAKAATKAVTLGAVKIDRRGRKVEIKLATSTDLDAFTQAVTAVQSEPGRIALFLAYVKAQGWTE
jgi:DNA-binding transcriptional regulator YdaS (Cro superfamily)